jgi:hypothetical protein
LIDQYTPEDLQRSLTESTAGVFEVTRVDPGRGVSLWDLAALHEYAVDEALGSQLLRPGDLIAGRIFPVAIDGAPLHRLSRAAAMWRDPRLLAAVKKDLEHAREMRPAHLRGTLRLRQSEIEAMFHTAVPQTAERADPSASGDQPVADARAVLEAGGLHPSTIEAMLGRLAREAPGPASLLPGASDALGEILEELAFESNVDLEAARRALLLAWVAIHANDRGGGTRGGARPDSRPDSRPGAHADGRRDRDRRVRPQARRGRAARSGLRGARARSRTRRRRARGRRGHAGARLPRRRRRDGRGVPLGRAARARRRRRGALRRAARPRPRSRKGSASSRTCRGAS